MLDRAALIHEYITLEKSTSQIAKEYNTYPTTIMRLLDKYQIPKRTASESLGLAHKKGLREAPFKDGMPEHIKNKIGASAETSWTESRKEKQSKDMKEKWKTISEEEKQDQLTKMHQKLRITANAGSRLEKAVEIYLVKKGYIVEPHKNLLQNNKLEVDLYLSNLSTIIEINGPSHYKPIWGEEQLDAQQKADRQKRGNLLVAGFRLIIIKMVARSSRTRLNRLFTNLEKALNGTEQFYEIEF